MSAAAILLALVGTPLAGLTFELPGDGSLGFAAMAVLAAAALVVLRSAPLQGR